MKTKEAIKWVFDIWHEWENVYGISGEISLVEGKKMDEVIERLKRGEKFEKMCEKLENSISEFDRGADTLNEIYELKLKYFPKEK